MTPNVENLTALFTSYSAVFNKALAETPSYYKQLAMVVPSATRESQYGWLASTPNLREWLGDRVIHQLAVEGFIIKNREFEATVGVKRTDIEDDQYGVYAPMIEKMGADAAQHPDKLALSLLPAGFANLCYDGQYFFDTDHPVGGAGDAAVTTASNFGGGAGTPWYLLDASQALKPLVFQTRVPYQFDQLDRVNTERVFIRSEYLYGVRARCNAGYGLWQLAYASKQTLDATAYANARAAMMNFKKDNGEPLNVRPTHLIVPPSLEATALGVIKATALANGATNIWAGTAELIVSPYVS